MRWRRFIVPKKVKKLITTYDGKLLNCLRVGRSYICPFIRSISTTILAEVYCSRISARVAIHCRAVV